MNINLALDVDNSVDDVDNASLKRTKLSFAIIDWIEFLRIEEHVSMLEMELNHLKENAKKRFKFKFSPKNSISEGQITKLFIF